MSDYERRPVVNDNAYLGLLRDVLRIGVPKPERTGVGMLEVFGAMVKFELQQGVAPTLLSRKLYPAGVIGELCAFLNGTMRLSGFKRLGCNYWDANAAAWPPNHAVKLQDQSLGRVYGAQWRRWEGHLDQIEQLIKGLEHDPTSRRNLITAWNPAELGQMCLPPCHLIAQFTVTGDKLDCAVYMRSCDLCVGLPSDFMLYGLLTHLLADRLGYKPGFLTFAFGSAHIYNNHIQTLVTQHLPRSLSIYDPGLSYGTLEINLPLDLKQIDLRHIRINDYKPLEPVSYAFNV